MFGKVIVFGLFEMIQKKKVRTASLGPGLASRSGRVQRCKTSHCTFTLQNRIKNLHQVKSYCCIGLGECGMPWMSSPVPTRMKHPC